MKKKKKGIGIHFRPNQVQAVAVIPVRTRVSVAGQSFPTKPKLVIVKGGAGSSSSISIQARSGRSGCRVAPRARLLDPFLLTNEEIQQLLARNASQQKEKRAQRAP